MPEVPGWLWGTAVALLFLTYPFLLQWLDVNAGGYAPLAIATILLWRAARTKGKMRWLLAGLGISLGMGVILVGPKVSRWVPAVAFLFVAWEFGRTLMIHPPPLIERMVRLQYREIPPYLLVYLRRLTWVWCVLFLVMAMVSMGLSMAGDDRFWFWFHALGIYLLMAALLLGEFFYRRWRFSELGEMPLPHETFRAVAREGRRLWEE